MKDWTMIVILVALALIGILGWTSWGAYNAGVEELCQSLGWHDGGSGFSGPAYCSEESPDGNETRRCVWTDAAAGECAPLWPEEG